MATTTTTTKKRSWHPFFSELKGGAGRHVSFSARVFVIKTIFRTTLAPKRLVFKRSVSLIRSEKCKGQMMFRRSITNTQLLFFFVCLQHAASHGGLYKGVNGQWQLGLIDSVIIWWRGATGAVLCGQLASTGGYRERRKPWGGMIARTLFNRYVDALCGMQFLNSDR